MFRDVEVVRRLVEQQQVGLLHERAGQSDAPAPAARELVHSLVGRDLEVRDRLVDALLDMPAVVGVDLGVQRLEFAQALLVEIELRLSLVCLEQLLDVGQPGAHDVAHGRVHRFGQRLRELADDQVAVAHDIAAIMLELARDQFQGRGLAGAVAADQAHALTGLDRQVGLAQDDVVAECERDFVEAD